MNQKQVGVLLIVIGLLIGGLMFYAKIREDFYIEQIIDMQEGACFLEDGTCLHEDRDFTWYYIGGFLAAAILGLGVYSVSFDKTQKTLLKQHEQVTEALKEAKDKDEWSAYLAGFTPEEQLVLKAVKEQEGIQQATLRYRTGMSKTSLSLLLKSLEDREIITRKESGKTNEVYVRKKF